jgi:hypothetical protein
VVDVFEVDAVVNLLIGVTLEELGVIVGREMEVIKLVGGNNVLVTNVTSSVVLVETDEVVDSTVGVVGVVGVLVLVSGTELGEMISCDHARLSQLTSSN